MSIKKTNHIPDNFWQELDAPYHRTGRTTRLVDQALQELFEYGCTIAYDHHPTRMAQEFMFDKLLRRISIEHQAAWEDIQIDKMRLIISLKSHPNQKENLKKLLISLRQEIAYSPTKKIIKTIL